MNGFFEFPNKESNNVNGFFTRCFQKFSSYLQSIGKKNAAVKIDDKQDYISERKYVGNIVIGVLTERLSVRKALTLFPKGCEDDSIRAAWHALCHYEADEDMQYQDLEYKNQQVELLELIAYEFKDGNPLPQNIVEAYKPYYKNNPLSYQSGLKGIFKKLFRFINF